MTDLKIRVFCEHNHADPDGWKHSWFVNGEPMWLDKRGRKNGTGRPWVRVVCALSLDCPALAFVAAEALEDSHA